MKHLSLILGLMGLVLSHPSNSYATAHCFCEAYWGGSVYSYPNMPSYSGLSQNSSSNNSNCVSACSNEVLDYNWNHGVNGSTGTNHTDMPNAVCATHPANGTDVYVRAHSGTNSSTNISPIHYKVHVNVYTTCDSGWNFNTQTSKCEKYVLPTCSGSGFTFNTGTNRCEKVTLAQLPANTSYCGIRAAQ